MFGRGVKLCNEVQDTAPEFPGFGISFTNDGGPGGAGGRGAQRKRKSWGGQGRGLRGGNLWLLGRGGGEF